MSSFKGENINTNFDRSIVVVIFLGIATFKKKKKKTVSNVTNSFIITISRYMHITLFMT